MREQEEPRGRVWLEAVLVLCVAAETVLGLVADASPLGIAQAAVCAVGGIALLFRRRHWRWLLPLVLLSGAFSGSLVSLFVPVYGVALRTPRRWVSALVALLALGCALIPLSADRQVDLLLWAAVIALAIGTTAVLGMYARARQLLLQGLRDRAEVAESRRSDAEEDARRAERTRIAREMHDIVAHKISLVALQAGALEVNPTLDRQKVVESAGLIRATATEALSELREVLGVLRGAGEGAPLVPQPTWEDVRRLVDTSREAGVQVDLFDFVDDPVPNALARTVYRVVQEGLTNIHKHARYTAARVALIGEPGDDLIVEVSNVLPRGFETDLPGARMGLSGIEARVTHAGGTITSGPTDDGRFAVRAVIPWPRPTP